MQYLIIGNGPAGVIAAETLRSVDRSGAILLLGAETERPYSRMALPYLLANEVLEEGTYLRRQPEHFESRQIELKTDSVTAVDARQQTVTTASGKQHTYDRLLVASGSHTVRPPLPGMALAGVENCWTLADARRIIDRAKPGSRVVLMGAGFIGCIVLEALAARKVQLTVVEMSERMLPRMMDDVGGDMIKRWCERKNVTVLTSTAAQEVTEVEGHLRVAFADGNTVDADLIVCATGVQPNVDFLADTGVELQPGVVVDHHLQSRVKNIFAAGDVAAGPDFSTGGQEIHAIQPTASEHGRLAALNMAGRPTPFRGSLSMNVLNTLGLVSSSFGLWQGVSGGQSAIASSPDEFRYLRLEFSEDRLVGALALGLTQHVGVLRGLVQTRVRLGGWKDKLLANPHRVMDAYLEQTQGGAQITKSAWRE